MLRPIIQYFVNPLCRGPIMPVLMMTSFLLQADTGRYLEKNTVYCHNKHALASYLVFVKSRDMPGLNMMVESGECDFSPDDANFPVPKYRTERIDATKVIAFSLKGKTVWTFEKLLKSL